ncbi:hypothetical protein BKI52_32830 [marine bacterium AO1-C]|nr:hypothetical protein BKI52_32830 [marine bacterium AO1-C]
MKNIFTHASLCSGIGACDLAAEWMGWENVFHCEIDSFCRTVLEYHFPNSISYSDVKKTDFTKHKSCVNVLTAGFPCQPFSNAGTRRGATDDRYLWPQIFRAIQQIEPNWIVLENVTGILQMVFPSQINAMEIQTDIEGKIYHQELAGKGILLSIIEELETEGYQIQPFVIPALAVGAPHRRDRVWIIANTNKERWEAERNHREKRSIWPNKDGQVVQNKWPGESGEFIPSSPGSNGVTANSNIKRPQRKSKERNTRNQRENKQKQSARFLCSSWEIFPTQPPIYTRNDGVSPELDGITFPSLRVKSIEAGGNAMVPQVVYEIFKAIEVAERGEL